MLIARFEYWESLENDWKEKLWKKSLHFYPQFLLIRDKIY